AANRRDRSSVSAIKPFAERYREALADGRLPSNLLAFQRAWRTTRDAAFGRLASEAPRLGASTTDFESAQQRLIAAKDTVLDAPVSARAPFLAAAERAGTHVHEAGTAEVARDLVQSILQKHRVSLLAKGKSMVAEEIFLNEHLERAGIRVVETDLGEWII